MKRNIYNQQPSVQLMTQDQKAAIRKPRKPVHQFRLRVRPFHIQPFAIAPVLAGETLLNAKLQARSVTKPLKDEVTGWWAEHFLFYVKLRDIGAHLEKQDEVEQMLLDQSAPYTADTDVSDTVNTLATYHSANGGVNWTKKCRDLIVKEYFTDEGVTRAEGRGLVDGAPVTKIMQTSFWESLQLQSAIEGIGDPVVVNTAGSTDNVYGDELAGALNTWWQLYGQQQNALTFEEYLKTFGVHTKREELGRPELLKYWRDWQYPSNTVNNAPVLDSEDNVIVAAGQPTSAVSWGISGRMDKNYRFKEPGFVVGICVYRPKVYVNQDCAAAHMLNAAFDWQPALMNSRPETTVKQFAQQYGPLGGIYNGNAYAVDTKDLFMYGDQFKNYGSSDIDPLIEWDGQYGADETGYPAETWVDRPFVSSDENYVSCDGVLELLFSGRAGQDMT